MKKTCKVTKEEIGYALLNFIALREGKRFFPYFISKTTGELKIPKEVVFTLSSTKGMKSSEIKHNI